MSGAQHEPSAEKERLTILRVTMTWEPTARLFHASYAPGARPRGSDAVAMLAWMDERAGAEAPFGLLVDLAHADRTAVAWRYRWMGWFYANRRRMRVAIYHAEGLDAAVAPAFARSTGTTIRSFPSGTEARAWLEEWLSTEPI